MSGFGDTLRHARANKGVTLTEAERAIRIPRKYLRALEDEDFDQLPEGVYARGIVRNYAQYLYLDPDDAVAYFEELRGAPTGSIKVVPAVKPMDVPSHWAPNFALIAFMVVISAVLFAWLYSALFAAREVAPTPTSSIPTPTPLNTATAILALTPAVTPTVAATATPVPPAPSPTAVATQAAPAPPPQPAAARPAGQSAPAPAPAPPPPPPPPPPPRAAPAPQAAENHAVTVKALEEAWVVVMVDGEVEYAGVMEAGETLDVAGSTIVVQSGNAQNVYLWVDGGEYGLLSTSSWNAEASFP